jgi:hypothetical protein
LGGWQLALEPEATAVVEVPPRQRASAIGGHDLLDASAQSKIAFAAYPTTGDTFSPSEEVRLGVRRGEAGELHHLVDPELTVHERARDARKIGKGMARRDPASRFPIRDAVAHPQPVRHVARPGPTPRLSPIDLRDQGEELSLCAGHSHVRSIDVADQLLLGSLLVLVHSGDAPIRGRNRLHRRRQSYRTYVRFVNPCVADSHRKGDPAGRRPPSTIGTW